MTKNNTRLPENTRDGLGRRFTHEKLQEGKVLKQVDKELLTTEREKRNTTQRQLRSTHDKQI